MGSNVYHAQANKDRVEKIININFICKEKKLSLPNLRSCWSDPLGRNCLTCEKCISTYINIIAAGQAPREYGFNIDIKKAIREVRILLRKKKYLHADQIRHWQCNLLHLNTFPEQKAYATLPNKKYIKELRNFLHSINFDRYRNPHSHIYSTQERELFATLWEQNMKEVKI